MINAFLVLLYGANNKDFGNHLVYPLLTFGLFMIGLALIMQRKFLVMMKNVGKDMSKGVCNCCKCSRHRSATDCEGSSGGNCACTDKGVCRGGN